MPASPDLASLPRNNARTEPLGTLSPWVRTPMAGRPLVAPRNPGTLCRAPTGLLKASAPTLSSPWAVLQKQPQSLQMLGLGF